MTRAAIIGGGIAGACTAHALHRYGASVTLFEQNNSPAAEASGNPAGLVMPRLDAADNAVARFHRAAFLYAVGLYENLGAFTAQGLTDASYDAEKLAKLAANPPLPPDWLEFRGAALFHHRAGVVAPPALIEKLLEGISVKSGKAARLANVADYDAIIICAGRLLADFVQAPFSYRAGQVDWMPGQANAMMGAEGYAVPCGANIVFGATHDVWGDPHALPTVTAAATARNIEKLRALNGGLLAGAPQTTARTGIRVALPDRMPLAAHIRDNIYALGALGARGLTTAPLLAEHVACTALGIASPLTADLATLVAARH